MKETEDVESVPEKRILGVRIGGEKAYRKNLAYYSKKGIKGLNRFFMYDPEFPGNPPAPGTKPSTRSTKCKNKKAKAGRRAARLNRG